MHPLNLPYFSLQGSASVLAMKRFLVYHPQCLTAVCFCHILEMDEEDCERRRMECLDEMSNLEKQFTDLKEQYD